MRKGLLGSIAALAASAGLAFAQSPAPTPFPPAPPGYSAPGPDMLPPGAPPFGGPSAAPGLLTGLAGDYPNGTPGPDSERGYLTFDNLVWFTRAMPRPPLPLVTGGTTLAGGTFPDLGSSALFGGQNFRFNPEEGGRVTAGWWSHKNPLWGLEWSAFVLEQRIDRFHMASGQQVVARPFIDADAGVPNSFLVSFPGFLRDDVSASVKSQFWGSEWNAQRKLVADSTKRVSFLIGFRYLDLHEDLSVSSTSSVLPGNTTSFFGQLFPAPARITVADSFDTRNQYMAGQIGLKADLHYNRWTFNWGTKLGLGGVYQTVDITGVSKLVAAPGQGANEVLGGLLALDSNIGRHHTGSFVVIPEGNLQATYRFCGCVDLGIGYNFLYVSRALRPSEQIDPQLSTTRIPTSAAFGFPGGVVRPVVPFNQSDFWAQGLNFAVSFHY